MLDSYHDEVRKKRNNHAIFWGVVFVFGVLLFMFFQGYYFSVSVGFEQLLQKHGPTEQKQPLSQILKSFGIINLKVNPNPQTLTLNGEPYTNGDNKFVDYGDYELRVEEPGYIPLMLEIGLSRNHSFYLNTIRLFKNPIEKTFVRPTVKIEKLGSGFLSYDSSGSVYQHASSIGTGTLLDSILLITGSGTSTVMNTGSGISPLGEGFFLYKNRVHTLNVDGVLVADDAFKSIIPCPDARMIYREMYCPGTKKFLTGKYKDLRDTILEVNSQFIRTESSLIRL